MKVKNDHCAHSSTTAVQIWIISYIYFTSFHSSPHGRYELNKLTPLPMCGFIAQLVEHRTGVAEVTSSNPVEVLIFFRLLSNYLNWKFTAMIIFHFHLQPQFKYELLHIYFTSKKNVELQAERKFARLNGAQAPLKLLVSVANFRLQFRVLCEHHSWRYS